MEAIAVARHLLREPHVPVGRVRLSKVRCRLIRKSHATLADVVQRKCRVQHGNALHQGSWLLLPEQQPAQSHLSLCVL